MIKNIITKNPDTDIPIISVLYFYKLIQYFMKMYDPGTSKVS
jgi:hypothetical protein